MADSKKNTTKYKFGLRELNMLDYLENIGYNVLSYLEDRRKNRGWTDDQVQEFSTAYNRLMDAYKQLLATGSNRFSTTDLGDIVDSQGEFTNIDNDDIDPNGSQYYYNDKGERITTDDYNNLKDKKKKNFKTFNANRLVAEYFRTIGNKMKDAPKKETEKFDLSKHGFVSWWNLKFNPAGGKVNLKPFLDKDPLGTDGKRPVSARAKLAAGWINEYLDWLKDKDLDYSNYDQFKDYDTYANQGRALAQKWNDNNWDADDLIAGQAFGISNDFSEGFFSTEENPDLTSEQREAKAAEEKAKEETAKKEQQDKNWKSYVDQLVAAFTNSKSPYTNSNPYTLSFNVGDWYDSKGNLNKKHYVSSWEKSFLDKDGNLNSNVLNTYMNNFVLDPFNAKYKNSLVRNILGLVFHGLAQPITSGDMQGMYYIPSRSDEQYNRALVYDPNTHRMFYTFIGDIPSIWEARRQKYNIDNGIENANAKYYKEGGIVSMQLGGDFGNAFIRDRNKIVEEEATKAGTSVRKYLNDRRKIAGEANAFDNNNGGLTEADKYHIAGLVGDVGSIIGSFSGAATMGTGSLVGAGIGAAGTTSHLIGDIKEDGFQWSDVGRAAVGYGLDLLGIVPGAGATKFGKVSNGILKIAPKLATIVASSAAVMNAEPILKSLKKVTTDTSNMTIEDWRNVSLALMLALGGARAAAGKRTFDKVRPKTGEVAIDLKNKRTGEIETRKFSGDTAKKLQKAKSNEDVIAILQKENPALGEYELTTSTSWIPRPQWIRKNGWIGDGWQYPVRFDSKRVRPMAVRIDRRAGDIEYATPQSPLKDARTKLVTKTKEEINEEVVKSEIDKLAEASKAYEKELKAAPNRIKAIKVSKEKVEKALADKDFVKQEDFDAFKSKGEGMKGKGHDALIDRIVARKKDMMSEEGAKRQQKYYEGLIKKLEEFKADGHTKAYQDFAGRKNAEGIIEFTTPGGETIKRDFAQLMERYKNIIKHEEGGKFTAVRKYQLGNPIRNVKSKANWFDNMYRHTSMREWLKKWTPQEEGEYSYKNFNELQDRWYNNLRNTGYNPEKPDQAMGIGNSQSQDVYNRQKDWNKTGTNAAIEDAVSKKLITRNGGTADNPKGNYLDGYFGALEYLRHGGTGDSWYGHDEDLAALREEFKSKGLEYYQDPDNGMYKLRPLSKGEVPQNINNSQDTNGTILQHEEDTGNNKTNNTKGTFDTVRKFNIDPQYLSIANNLYANTVNDKMTDRSIDAARKSLTLYDLKDTTKYLLGDFDALMAGELAAGLIYNLASQPITSDGAVLTSAYLDSAIKAQDYIRQGRVANNQALKKSRDELWAIRQKDSDFNYDVAMKNRQSIGDLIDNIANLRNARDAKRYANDTTLFQELMYPLKLKANKREALEEQFALSDIKNAVKYNLKEYVPDIPDEELDAWNQVLSGDVQYSDLSKDKLKLYLKAALKVALAEQNAMRGYYGIAPSKFKISRTLSQLDDFSGYRPSPNVTSSKKGGTITLKDGSKVAVAKIRERSKDADRFYKTTKDRHDRIDKAIARVDKKMYRRRDPEKRRK